MVVKLAVPVSINNEIVVKLAIPVSIKKWLSSLLYQ